MSPAELVLPRDGDDVIALTGRMEVPGPRARSWAAGHTPLPTVDVINWRRPPFHLAVREDERAELRQRVELPDT